MDVPDGMVEVPRGGGAETVAAGVLSVFRAKDDPEDSLLVSLTHRDVALLVFALFFPANLLPELAPDIVALVARLQELTDAQEFNPDERDEDA